MAGDSDKTPTLPLVEEDVSVTKQTVERGRVRIRRRTVEDDQELEVPTFEEEAVVERVLIDREITEAPSVREEDGVLIIPVVREEVVVTKRLILEEEVHIRKVRHQQEQRVQTTTRRQEVDVDRSPPENTHDKPEEAT